MKKENTRAGIAYSLLAFALVIIMYNTKADLTHEMYAACIITNIYFKN